MTSSQPLSLQLYRSAISDLGSVRSNNKARENVLEGYWPYIFPSKMLESSRSTGGMLTTYMTCRFSCTLPRLSALPPAPIRTHSSTLPHVIMHGYWQENDKSPKLPSSDACIHLSQTSAFGCLCQCQGNRFKAAGVSSLFPQNATLVFFMELFLLGAEHAAWSWRNDVILFDLYEKIYSAYISKNPVINLLDAHHFDLHSIGDNF